MPYFLSLHAQFNLFNPLFYCCFLGMGMIFLLTVPKSQYFMGYFPSNWALDFNYHFLRLWYIFDVSPPACQASFQES